MTKGRHLIPDLCSSWERIDTSLEDSHMADQNHAIHPFGSIYEHVLERSAPPAALGAAYFILALLSWQRLRGRARWCLSGQISQCPIAEGKCCCLSKEAEFCRSEKQADKTGTEDTVMTEASA